MLFVVHALDKKDFLPTRAKHYRDHRIHLDKSGDHGVDVVTAGTLLADDGETPVGSIFVIDAAGPRRGRCLHPQRSLSRQRRVGARRHPPLQQETRHRDREQALTFIRPRDSGEGDHWSSRSERTVVEGAPKSELVVVAEESPRQKKRAKMFGHHLDSASR